ncbi:MAG: alpha/beta hydrolase [Chloroflexus sp.]|nr:MAG: alpha/beta hydrolase [Chloroflexus sp.]
MARSLLWLRRVRACHRLLWLTLLMITGCTPTARPEARPTPNLDPISAERREVVFSADDGVTLAGELTLPRHPNRPPLVVVIHHAGPVDRDAYGYLAELLVDRGYAVFRFDKRGTGASGGVYGCCEAEDALAAYRAAVAQPGIDPQRVFIVAQSIGTRYVAASFPEYVAAMPPCGVALLSNLLGPVDIIAIAAPIHVIVADSEPDRQRIGPDAVAAHNAHWSYGASLYIAEGAEHTLFDIRDGPIDWSNPNWVQRYHRGAMASLLNWLDEMNRSQCRT